MLRLHAGQGEVNRRYKNNFANNMFLHTFLSPTDTANLAYSDDNNGSKMEFNTLHIYFGASKSS